MVQEYTVIIGYGDSEKDEYTIFALNKEHAEFIVKKIGRVSERPR